MINTYYIGGSPCSGKSTIAEIVSKKYDLYYFKFVKVWVIAQNRCVSVSIQCNLEKNTYCVVIG